MAKNLVIVESPTKAETIGKILGSNYEVIASNGHVRDLPKSQMGIDVENDFEPKYITIRGKGDILTALRKAVKKADKVYLATDPDREGEAISYHLSVALKLQDKKYKRITFNEVTKTAVKNSLKNARDIDMNLVDAQQARRVLDRLVGYKISPVLWAKIKRGLSAGRVQSVALKIICDREKEINDFIPKEYFSLVVNAETEKGKKEIPFRFVSGNGEKEDISSAEALNKIVADISENDLLVKSIKQGEKTRKSPLPFTTSTLQQEASSKLNFATTKTMRIAQQLYEGINIKGKGTIGLITYLRTDSTRISEEADASARKYIGDNYGEKYIETQDGNGRQDKGGKKIQDAHEAIRPTDITLSPVKIKDELSRDQYRLYQLIYNRFLASRMANAVYETRTVKAVAGEQNLQASSSKLAFDGFMAVYNPDQEKSENIRGLNELKEGDVLKITAIEDKQHFTQPPARYTEASLVKTLEEKGIGRPSTYAPTISTILARRYITKENKKLYVTEIGEAVNNIMEQAFPVIVDVNFTANLESLLDTIGEGAINWKVVVRNFYPDLDDAVKKAEADLEKIDIQDEVSDEICDECGRNMVVKYGPHGKFLACPGFPDCKCTKPFYEKIGVTCPKCKTGDVVIKMSKKGRRYYGCTNAPECDFMSWTRPAKQKCPQCGSYMLIKGKKLLCANNECGYTCDAPKEEA
ncbi:dNA topoisomerase [Coprococcus sp. CAG:782]|jgi:DNA topoisomerase-1|uniref:type I DNA topoisomerase n=1 Tax=Coprococcus sp. OM04-5BH TaxID=2293093 RepID=UPI0003400081|nr:type I DNA topoisomerase [Coprococcus sp. OM04-5BH]MEE0035269.1 type I DNA topoisomerase [Coprococcus sp.]RHV31982.1 type I DNA topoisomerase [Coprococcus sp. OM04-5BH]CCY53530.1 dNA topoisomerase [Coprococcus sp. CAG:782]